MRRQSDQRRDTPTPTDFNLFIRHLNASAQPSSFLHRKTHTVADLRITRRSTPLRFTRHLPIKQRPHHLFHLPFALLQLQSKYNALIRRSFSSLLRGSPRQQRTYLWTRHPCPAPLLSLPLPSRFIHSSPAHRLQSIHTSFPCSVSYSVLAAFTHPALTYARSPSRMCRILVGKRHMQEIRAVVDTTHALRTALPQGYPPVKHWAQSALTFAPQALQYTLTLTATENGERLDARPNLKLEHPRQHHPHPHRPLYLRPALPRIHFALSHPVGSRTRTSALRTTYICMLEIPLKSPHVLNPMASVFAPHLSILHRTTTHWYDTPL
ncbi:hypothetical protein BDN70DRAFT_346888 [Pholiota conissans]|uniref:Uncharacterized protein n=1 Tax=Pholiota conissans TaxID=109636 RepID=A0A9P6CUK6_9AGAR|nr:hypothetical protein BDN70DRAFT_346888 [Pholiota conissans]